MSLLNAKIKRFSLKEVKLPAFKELVDTFDLIIY